VNRYKASLVHFLLSLAVAGLVFVAIRYLWYPGPLFEVAGGVDLLLLVISVDVTLGPFITLVVFVPGKRGLGFDLSFIAALQVAALLYGLAVIFEARPVFITFVKDRFEMVRAGELDDRDLARGSAPAFRDLPWFGYRVAGARIPTDPAEQLALMQAALSGKDVQYYPRYYVGYASVRAQAVGHAQPMGRLRELNPGRVAEVDDLVARYGPEPRLGFLPMRAGKRDMTVVIERSEGRIEALSSLRPWEY